MTGNELNAALQTSSSLRASKTFASELVSQQPRQAALDRLAAICCPGKQDATCGAPTVTLLEFARLAISSQFLLEATVLVVLRNSWRKGPQTIWTMVRAICGFLGTAAAGRSCANAPTSIDEALFLEPTGPAAPRRVDGTVRNTTSSVGEHRERKAKEVRGKAPRLRQRGAYQNGPRSCNTQDQELG